MKFLNNEFDFINEIPIGSFLKYEIDKNSNLTIKDKREKACPFNYGFLNKIKGDDNDYIDCFLIDIKEPIFPRTKLKVEICGSFLLTDENGGKELKLVGVFDKSHKINKDNMTEVKEYIKFCKGEEKALRRKVSKFHNKEKTSEFFKDYVLIRNAALIKTYNGSTIPYFENQIIINKKDIKFLETTWEKGDEYFGSFIKEGLINYDGYEVIIKKGIIYMF